MRIPCEQHSWSYKENAQGDHDIVCIFCGVHQAAAPIPPSRLETAAANARQSIELGVSKTYWTLKTLFRNRYIFAFSLVLMFIIYKVITYDYVIEREPTGNERFSTESISCTYYDYCYGCDSIDHEGNLSCGFRYGTCNGSQDANLRYDEYAYTRKSGAQRITERRTVLKKLNECE